MSNVSSNISSEDLAFILALYQVSNSIGFFAIPAVCVAGVLLNLTNLILLARSNLNRLNTTCYESIFCKSFTDIVVCFFGALNLNFACQCVLESEVGREWSGVYNYWHIAFLAYIEIPCLRIALLASAYAELAVLFNRCRVLFNVATTYSLTKTGRIANFYIFSAIPLIPIFLMFKPVQIGESWYGAVTEFALTNTVKIYVICIFLLESLLPIVLLTVFSLVAMAKFNQRVKRYQGASGVIGHAERLNREDVQFSRLILFILAIFITTRSVDMIAGVFIRFRVFIFNDTDHKRDATIYLIRQLAYLLLFTAHAFSSIFYYYAKNSKLKKILPFAK